MLNPNPNKLPAPQLRQNKATTFSHLICGVVGYLGAITLYESHAAKFYLLLGALLVGALTGYFDHVADHKVKR